MRLDHWLQGVMKGLSLVPLLCSCFMATTVWAGPQFSDYAKYCEIASQATSSTLAARVGGMSRADAVALMEGMTDPLAIRMVKESIEFAWSQPPAMGVDAMRSELKRRCLAREVFVQ